MWLLDILQPFTKFVQFEGLAKFPVKIYVFRVNTTEPLFFLAQGDTEVSRGAGADCQTAKHTAG